MEIKNVENSILCRICCKSCSQNVDPVDDLTKKMLTKLLLDPDIFMNEAPFICNICLENVERCYYFKLSCSYTENIINSYVSHNPSAKCDLFEVYLNNNGNNSNVPEDHIVCRLCMVLVNSSSCWYLSDEIEDTTKLLKVLGQHFPEMDLRTTKDPAVCMNCLTSLQNYFEFVKYCLQNTMSDVKAECEVDTLNNNECEANENSDCLNYGGSEMGECLEEEDLKLEIKVEDVCVEKDDDLDSRDHHDYHYRNMCFYKAENVGQLQKHKTTHTNINRYSRTYVCSSCEFKTKYKGILKRHLDTHLCTHGGATGVGSTRNPCESCRFKKYIDKFTFNTVAVVKNG